MKVQKVLTGLKYDRPITKEQALREFHQNCKEKVLATMKRIALKNNVEETDKFVSQKVLDPEEAFVSRLGKLEGENLTPGQLWNL